MATTRSVLFLCLLYMTKYSTAASICDLPFCTCTEKELDCTGTNTESLVLTSSSLTRSLKSLSLRRLASVTVEAGALSLQTNMNTLTIADVGHASLHDKIFGETETESFLTTLTLSNLALELSSETFVNSPRCSEVLISGVNIKKVPQFGLKISADTITIENCVIDELGKESIYSDALHCNIINNTIHTIREKAFDASIRWLNFSLNDIGRMEDRAISAGFLRGDISRNIFRDLSGTPLKDIGPDPVCMPDPDNDPDADYNEVKYNVVANPRLVFSHNTFSKFNISFLEFPGAKNVPLGSLSLSQNRVPCTCETIKDLAVMADFDHIIPQPDNVEYGDILFKKEFYASAICDQDNGTNMRLKKFARAWLAVSGDDDDDDDDDSEVSVSCREAPLDLDLVA